MSTSEPGPELNQQQPHEFNKLPLTVEALIDTTESQ